MCEHILSRLVHLHLRLPEPLYRSCLLARSVLQDTHQWQQQHHHIYTDRPLTEAVPALDFRVLYYLFYMETSQPPIHCSHICLGLRTRVVIYRHDPSFRVILVESVGNKWQADNHPMDHNETLLRYQQLQEWSASATNDNKKGPGIRLAPKKSGPYYVINCYLSSLSFLDSPNSSRAHVHSFAPSVECSPGFY